MKTVFNSSQVCHVWASQSQSYGKNHGGTIFFENETIYSYGYHYPMGVIYNRRDGDTTNIVLFNSEGYSPTTSQHQSHASSAVTHLYTIYVPEPDFPERDCNREFLINNFKEQADKLKRVRKVYSVQGSINSVRELIEVYYDFCSAFSITPETYDIDELVPQKVVERLQRQAEKTQKTLEEKERKRRQSEEEARKEEQPKLIKWLNGQNISLRGDLFEKVYLRIKNGEVETSLGASVPLDHAKRLLKLIENQKASQGERVGHFQLDDYDSQKAVIGCHTIELNEAKRVLNC